MTPRKQKVEALLVDLQALRRAMTFRRAAPGRLAQITPSQWGVLMLVEQGEARSVKEVAKALGITSSAATQLVEGLVVGGYLARKTSLEDRRVIHLALSKKSESQVVAMKKRSLERFLKVFGALTDAEFDRYLELTKKIVEGSLIRR